MKKFHFVWIALALVLPACHRSSREVWEDTKTASRYMNKGLRSFMGRHAEANGPLYLEWNEEQEAPFLTLTDEDTYAGAPIKEWGNNAPLAKDSPGDPGSPIPGIDGFSNPSGALAALFKNIHFETDHYTIKGTQNIEILKTIADYLIKNPSTYVFVEGHADERGASAYNLALGSRRANSIRNFLVENGVNPNQLFTVSYGKERPLVLGHDEMHWSQNRRGEFKLYAR